eukprot:3379052-Pyramimonas_sp.AAC.1
MYKVETSEQARPTIECIVALTLSKSQPSGGPVHFLVGGMGLAHNLKTTSALKALEQVVHRQNPPILAK